MSTTTALHGRNRSQWVRALCILMVGSSGCFDPNAALDEDVGATATESDAVDNEPASPTAGESESGASEDPSGSETSGVPDGSTTDEPDPPGETGEPSDDSICGDGVLDAGEACDGDNLGGFDCEELGFLGGELQCAADCTFDTGACDGGGCGDGIVQAGESCDGTANGHTCADLTGLPDGEVTCSPTCTFDTSDCSAPANVRRVFITSEAFAADFGGALGADDVCQSVADAEGLGGTFMAWLSDTTTTPSQRFNHWAIPYALLDGTVIADDWGDLVDGQLYSAIDTTESVQPVDPDTTIVATATASNGTLNMFNGHCDDWTSATMMYSMTIGNEENTISWTESGAVSCDTPVKLYCFEQ